MPSRPEIERAWAAGFFDGEGCTIFVPQRAGSRLMCSIGQVDRRNLVRFQAAVDGIGSIGRPRSLPNRQPIQQWVAYNKAAMRAIALLSDNLGPAKRQQALNATHRYMYRLIRRPGPCKRDHLNPPVYKHPTGRGTQCAICRGLQRKGVALSPIVQRPAIEFEMADHEYSPPPIASTYGYIGEDFHLAVET